MKAFTSLRSRVVPLPRNDIDTDQIIPARFLKVLEKEGLGVHLFADWRYLADGSPNPDFIINQPQSIGAQILLAGDNFGCGSSREHAPWALLGWGFRAVVATSFADIFRSNALKNGLLPVALDPAEHAYLLALAQKDAEMELSIDLADRSLLTADGQRYVFPIEPFARKCLLEGVDQLGYLLAQAEQIAAYEAEHESF